MEQMKAKMMVVKLGMHSGFLSGSHLGYLLDLKMDVSWVAVLEIVIMLDQETQCYWALLKVMPKDSK